MLPAIMVMGVSGCGKSTIGSELARLLNGRFLDGDDYHPAENVAWMAEGRPLDDVMRWPWLDRLAKAVARRRRSEIVVFACSALKRSYRDYLRDRVDDLQIVYLEAPRDVVTTRLAKRRDHFMPITLLDSQYAVLEVPQRAAVSVSIDQPVSGIIAEVQAGLAAVI